MRSTSSWQGNFQSVVSNGRGHQVTLDLPVAKHGQDSGPTAFELSLMALTGCVSVIFAKIAKNSKVEFSQLDIETDGQLNAAEEEFTNIFIKVKIKSAAETKLLERILKKTESTCPVGIIFNKAKIPIHAELIKL
jgi:putative redox protein